MKFSNRIKELSGNPRYLSNNPLNYQFETHLSKLDIKIYIHFETYKAGELLIARANYYTDYKGEYLGVIEGFFSLIQGKPIEAADRFPIKELDYFLRDDSSKSAFTAYSQELYEIISLGEKMKSKIFGQKSSGFVYDPKKHGEFLDLSTGEQFEMIEELLSHEFFRTGIEPEDIELIDIDENALIFNANPDFQDDICKKVNQHIKNLIIKFN
jgi:hypothetical protein